MEDLAVQFVGSSSLVFTTLSIGLWLVYGVQYGRMQRARLRGGGGGGAPADRDGALLPFGFPVMLFMQLVIFVAQLVCFYNAVSLSRLARDNEFQYDEFAIALQWFPGACAGGRTIDFENCNTTAKKDYWTIRSLMADETRCATISYFNRHLRYLDQDRLAEAWPSYLSAMPDDRLWAAEWIEHGTCCKGHHELNSVPKYFHKALQLYEGIGLDSALDANNVRPSSANRLGLVELTQALEKITGRKTAILCRKGGQVLTEIQLCYDNEFNFKDCSWQPPSLSVYPPEQGGGGGAQRPGQDRITKCGEKFWYYPSNTTAESDAIIRQERLALLFGNLRWIRKMLS